MARGFVALLGEHEGRDAMLDAASGPLARAYGSSGRRASPSSLVVGDGDELDARVGVFDDGANVTFEAENCTFHLRADTFGRRSLYAATVGRACLVATRLDPIVAALRAAGQPCTLDASSLRAFLSLSFVPAPRTPYERIVAVPAAHACTFASGVGLSAPTRSYDPPIGGDAPSDDDAPKLVEAALGEAIAASLSASGPATILLSGGLDSAAVAIVAARFGGKLRALTIDFEEESEADVAAAIAAACGLEHARVLVTAQTAGAAIEDAIAALDTPIGDPVVVPFTVAARAIGAPTTVLTGEGGDQLFAGWATKPMLAWARYAAPNEDPTPTYLRTFHKLSDVEDEALGPFFRDTDPAVAERVIRPFLRGERAITRPSFMHRLCDANLWLKGAGNVLPRIDRVLAAAGHDALSPLVDRRVVAASFALAPTQKQRNTTEKWVLRRLLEGRLPPSILDRPKRGMRVPLKLWESPGQPLHDVVRDVLSPKAIRERGVFDEGFVARLIDGDVRAPDLRRRRRDEWLWLVLVTELWLRRRSGA